MVRVWLASALSLLLCAAAHAHGELPAAIEPLVLDAKGARMVRLNVGIARREGSAFRLLCAEAWGGDESAPSAALPNGTLVIAAPSGLFSMDEAGQVVRHPRTDVGRGHALARSGDELYGLVDHEGASQLLRITADDVEPVFETPTRLTTLRVTDQRIQLVGVTDQSIDALFVSHDGVELSRERADLVSYPLFAQARALGEQELVLLSLQRDARPQLGTLENARFVPMVSAQVALEGPLALDAGLTVLAVDGRITALTGTLSEQLAATEHITGLGATDGKPFVRVRDGLRELSEEGVGAALFRWEQLREPDWSALPDRQQQVACRTRWYHLTVDLIAAGVVTELAVDEPAQSSPSSRANGGCSVHGGAAERAGLALTWLLVLGWRLVVRPRRPACITSRP